MNERESQLELIRRYLDGTATAEEACSLEALLLSDAELRREFLRYAHLDAALAGNRQPRRAKVTKPEGRKHNWLQWRPMMAAAAGLMIGLFSASVVWATYTGPRMAKAVSLLKEGFETLAKEMPPGLPDGPGLWVGDESRVVPAEEIVKPRTGNKMLRMASATYEGENVKQSLWCDVYRLVDLRGTLGEAPAKLRLAANFSAAPFPAGEGYLCFVELCALEEGVEVPRDANLIWFRENSASVGGRKVPLKGDGVWKRNSVEVQVPPGTSFVLVHLAVMRTKPMPATGPVQFPGHYVDDVKLELLPQPRFSDP